MRPSRLVRTLVSYVPSENVLGLRRLTDLAGWLGRPHDDDYWAFRHYIRVSPAVVDVGANRGQAIASLLRMLDEPRVWAFEPNVNLAAYLEKRFGSQQITIFPAGLGSSRQTITLYLPRYGHTVWDTRASLIEENARRLLRPNQFWRFDERRAGIEQIDVAIRCLDEFALSPDILKVDVEGTESAVVEGGIATISAHVPVILTEGDAESAMPLLSPLGYRRYRFDPVRLRFSADQPGEVNTFLMVSAHHELFQGIDVVNP